MIFHNAGEGALLAFRGRHGIISVSARGGCSESVIKTVRSGCDARMVTFEYAGVTCCRGAKRRSGGGARKCCESGAEVRGAQG